MKDVPKITLRTCYIKIKYSYYIESISIYPDNLQNQLSNNCFNNNKLSMHLAENPMNVNGWQ